jgi:hypothetical protein
VRSHRDPIRAIAEQRRRVRIAGPKTRRADDAGRKAVACTGPSPMHAIRVIEAHAIPSDRVGNWTR